MENYTNQYFMNNDKFEEEASKISEIDIDNAADKASIANNLVKKSSLLRRYFDDVVALTSLIKDYRSGNYRKIPYWVIGSAAFTILYLINPFDILPDFIPGVGFIDDLSILSIGVVMIEKEFAVYKEWKERKNKF